MKRIKWIQKTGVLLAGMFLLCACSARAEFEKVALNITQLQSMIEDKETFVIMATRDECPYCEALNAYLNETAADHTGVVLYTIDTTSFDLYRDGGEATTLLSDTKNGKEFLQIFPYFLYTPSLYQIRDGVVINAGIGFNDENNTVSEWDVESTVRFEVADAVNVWRFIEDGQ